ncbi:hypothetical protein MASR2M79_23540 [Aminivibrio sp.]
MQELSAREQGEELFPESWYGKLDRQGLIALLEKMRSSSTIPYTLANALEAFSTAQGLGDEQSRLALAGKVLLAFLPGAVPQQQEALHRPHGVHLHAHRHERGIEPNFAWSWTRRIAKRRRGRRPGNTATAFSPRQIEELHENGRPTPSS